VLHGRRLRHTVPVRSFLSLTAPACPRAWGPDDCTSGRVAEGRDCGLADPDGPARSGAGQSVRPPCSGRGIGVTSIGFTRSIRQSSRSSGVERRGVGGSWPAGPIARVRPPAKCRFIWGKSALTVSALGAPLPQTTRLRIGAFVFANDYRIR